LGQGSMESASRKPALEMALRNAQPVDSCGKHRLQLQRIDPHRISGRARDALFASRPSAP